MAGLLGESWDDPRTAAVFAGLQGLLGGRNAITGLLGGGAAYTQTMAAAKQAAMMQQMHDLQLQQAKRQAAMQEAMDAAAKASTVDRAGIALSGGGGPTLANAAKMDALPSFDWAGYANRVAGINPMQGLQIQQALKKEQPKFSTAPQYDQNGRAFVLAEDGTMRYLDGVTARDKLISEDLGGKKVFRTEYSANPVASADKTMTTGDMVAMRGQNMTDARARELNAITREGQQTQVINDPERGVMFANKGTGLVRPGVGVDGKPLAGESTVKRENAAARTMPLLDEAEKLIDQATGSYIGAGVDKAAQAFGKATGGAQATAKLKVLEGNLMMSQPRMEGPQSDKDTLLYRQMAGQIGDPTVPPEIKRAALQTIRQIQERYSGKRSAQPAQIPGLKFLGFEGQ